ncbi:MBL fold metallo-hydrolase [Silvibacterium sp.]|uniref:MBL fold metallo-hydrolase n=1 Tax=Silvibacterium sp. TaxID=1964179 RepID=UPI0039E24895
MSVQQFSAPEAAFTAEQMMATGLHARIDTQELRHDITVLSGSGANIAVLNDREGKIMVESGFAISRPEIAVTLARISPHPVRLLINSHFHFDHTDGNAWLHDTGAEIVAESHTRMRMNRTQQVPAFRLVRAAVPYPALPGITFNHRMRIELKDESILLKRYGPAHTDGDIAIHFEQHDVLHTGDTWFHDIYPFVDFDGGGSIDGLIAAAKENLDLAGPRTLVVPGHGPVGNRQDLVDFYDMLTAVRSRVGDLKAAGLAFEDVLEQKPTERFDAKWGRGFIPAELFLWQIYQGI